MTKSVNDRRDRYVVTNPSGQAVFDITFPLSVTGYITVYQDGAALPNDGYTVDLDALTVTLDAAAPAGAIITLEGSRDVERTTDYPLRGDLRSGLLNRDMDSIIEMIQELRRDVDAALLKNKAESDNVSNVLPLLSQNRVLVWGESGLENGPTVENIEALSALTVEIATLAALDTDITGLYAILPDNIDAVNTAASNISAIIAAPGAASNAYASAALALVSREKAQQWAEEDEDTEVETGLYSAKHWAAKAAASAAGQAVNIAYDPSASSLTQTNVQDAIDEMDGYMTAAGRLLVGQANTGAMRSYLSLGTMATQNKGAVDIVGGTITGMPTPASSGDVATKGYVDGVIIGFNQTWTNVLASRSTGTTYTNTTGKPIIAVAEIVTTNTGNQAFTLEGYVDGVLIKRHVEAAFSSTYSAVCEILVPAGSTYKFERLGNTALQRWMELR